MMTLATIAIYLLLFVGAAVLNIEALRLGGRWAGSSVSTWRRVMLVWLLIIAVQLAAAVAGALLSSRIANADVMAAIVGVPLVWFIIARGFELPPRKAIIAWLPVLLISVLSIAMGELVSRFVTESFQTPTNTMAPTILGKHATLACPRCGSLAFCTVERHPDPNGTKSICSQFHTFKTKTLPTQLDEPDRFIVNKLLAPKRWDLIAFRYPAEPSTLYVKRLVGLPGEEVVIHDGGVWIDKRRLELPQELAGLEYLDALEPDWVKLHGTQQSPAQLGDDEYFVLGDFSAASSDSRVWGGGAPGHPSFAVPKSHLVGVVTNIYWPPARWRAFR